MTASRPYVLGGVFALFAPLVAVPLVDVLATVFFTITITYLLVPFRRRLETCRTSRWVISPIATVATAVGVDVVLAPLIIILFLHLSDILEPAALLPDVVTIELLRMIEAVTLDGVATVGLGLLWSAGRTAAIATLVVLIKLTLFGLLVFTLLFSGSVVGRTLPALVPADYRGTATMLNEQAHEMLSVIYVLQTTTAAGTFTTGLVIFWALGCDYAVTLATVTVVLQFISIVGPGALPAAMVAYHAAVGDVIAATFAVTLLVEPVDLLGARLCVDSVGGDDDERNEFADDSVNPSQP